MRGENHCILYKPPYLQLCLFREEQFSADYDELMESAINGNKHLKVLFEPHLREKQIA